MESIWFEELPVGITVCDEKGIILSMNDRASLIFKKSGGKDLIGRSLLDCHPPQARQKVLELLEKKQPHAYTLEKKGIQYLLYQAPWYEEGQFKGFVEFILALPGQLAAPDRMYAPK